MKKLLLLCCIAASHIAAYSQSTIPVFVNPVQYDRHLPYAVPQPLLDSLKEPITGFYKTYNGNVIANDHWLEEDNEKHFTPFMYLLTYLNYREPESLYPYVMSLSPDSSSGDYIARVALLRSDSTAGIEQISYIGITKNKDGVYKLKHPQDLLTKNWEHYQVGKGHYIVHPDKAFSYKEARSMDEFNNKMGRYFHCPPVQFKYFSCGYMNNQYYPQGDDNFFMTGNYTKMPAGNTLTYDSTIYSGNNSEYYPHELVHIYVTKVARSAKISTSWMAMEGICTFLGGSFGMPLEAHLEHLADYSRKNGLTAFGQVMSVPGGMVGDTNVTYATCGLMAKLIDKKEGYTGIVDFANITQDELFAFVADTLDVEMESIDSYLMKELMRY